MTIQQLFKTAPVTTLLLISFIGLYIVQVLSGVDANNPSTEALLGWGANALPYTMVDEPWRLISSAFLHIGLMHLLFNGFAMYFFGQIAEPMFGSAKFLVLFLLAAIGGNLLNSYVTWQDILNETAQPGISAGASGGIMGIGAALLIATFFKMSVNGMMLNLRSLIFIMGINLVYGFAVPGIDNAGHIGGALTGLVIALSIGIAHRQRTIALKASVPTYQTHYVNYPSSSDIYADNDSDIPVNSTINTDVNAAYIDVKNNAKGTTPTTIKPAIIWQWLPWIIMLLITIAFVWWWLDIHNQILQVLAASK
ncbi:rhomboid family intramembrane serine protease [Psychrobacter sp. LV10R520-6]|uniref:rhomboid family intramembrane serine protease n=1 Tax=Psychrobacter sp. LV10R520-6 TaxID=1415574 RepID=UPI0024C580FF|nr:rhomboid family intramembrane serine protease [Psychrobacter sp. LV10R520-6]SNT70337.1 Membrane associated serine protease, rhomboid family [Psychrobacter sp. LV10R520-6]